MSLSSGGEIKPIGFSDGLNRNVFGLEIDADILTQSDKLDWRDRDYQYVSPRTGKLMSNAQKRAF